MEMKERIKRSQAEQYKPRADYDELLELRDTDPAAFAKLPATKRLALGHYLDERTSWLELQGRRKGRPDGRGVSG